MLRRLLSNNQSQPTNLVAPIDDQPPAETGPTTVEEPREYILLSKMRPHPPSSIPFHGQPQSGYPPCPYPIPTAHLIQSSCWAQLDANSPPSFSFPTDEATDFYWPNFIPSTDNFNSNLGFSLIPSLPQIQTAPPQPPSFDHFPQNEKIYADQNGIEKVELVGKSAQKEEEGEEGQKTISKSNVRDKLESPAPSEEGGCPQSCPYCNRFQKVGSLRRHMAQCRRLKGIARGESVPPSKRPIGGSPAPVGNEKKPRIMNGNGQSHSPAPSHSSATVDPSDPYECEWCKFNTLYKGNMKRHLISCHRVSMEILQQMQFDVERLRKLAINRPAKDELPIQPRRDDTKGKGAAAERKDEKEEEFGDEEEEREDDEEGEEWE